jgi:hypothetical protein
VARGEDPPRELYTLRRAAESTAAAAEFELIALMTSARRRMSVYAFDPSYDPRRAFLPEKERRISLTNYLNFGAGGTRPAASGRGGHGRVLTLWSAAAEEGGPEMDARVDVDCDHVVAAHDFRVHNPAAAALRVAQAVRQHALFWLDDGSALSGEVCNLEQVLMRADDPTLFLSVREPRFYGTMKSAPWGTGLPYLALNRRYVLAKKVAASLEELEIYLAVETAWQPAGFTPDQLAAWDRLPEEVRHAAERAARPGG